MHLLKYEAISQVLYSYWHDSIHHSQLQCAYHCHSFSRWFQVNGWIPYTRWKNRQIVHEFIDTSYEIFGLVGSVRQLTEYLSYITYNQIRELMEVVVYLDTCCYQRSYRAQQCDNHCHLGNWLIA